MIKTHYGKLLHPNFVASLLSDLFGIQTGLKCKLTARQGFKLFSMGVKLSQEYTAAFKEGFNVLKMGFTRLTLHYYLNANDIEYVFKAIKFIALYGWMMLPHYSCSIKTG